MSNVDPNRRPSAFGRYVFMLLLGLVLGAMAVVMLMRTWEGRKTSQDRLPHALMHVQAWHVDQLKADMAQNRCNATDVLPHLQALRTTANDLEAAFPDLRDDQRFTAASTAMRAAMDKAMASPPLTCEGLGAAIKQTGETCKGCPQDFRT